MTISEVEALPPPPSLRLRIDRAALAGNWRTLNRLSGTARAGAAVKADAYGLGVAQVVPTLREAGAEQFFVAHWSEVAPVLHHAPPQQIAVLHGPVTGADAAYARALGVRPVINSLAQAHTWLEAGGGACLLMVDTGINRLGLAAQDLGDPLVARLEIEAVLSHLASADEDSPMNAAQLCAFRGVAALFPDTPKSLANSAGIALGSAYHFDLTRPGLALYGGVPVAALADRIEPVVTPQAAIIQLRDLSAGDAVGYNATFVADRAMRAATVSLGYADGILRCWGAGGALSHGGRTLAVLGRVSMDMVVIDCTSAPELREGDFLDLPYALPEAAGQTGLSQYELLTLLGRRFARS